MGPAYEPPDSLSITYVPDSGLGCAVRLEYYVERWYSAFFIKLQGTDLSPHKRLILDIRADPEPAILVPMKIELKRDRN